MGGQNCAGKHLPGEILFIFMGAINKNIELPSAIAGHNAKGVGDTRQGGAGISRVRQKITRSPFHHYISNELPEGLDIVVILAWPDLPKIFEVGSARL